MASRARDRQGSASWHLWSGVLDVIEFWKTIGALRREGDSSATLNRFFTSRHVHDLKLIAGVAFWIAIILAAVLLAYELGLMFSEAPTDGLHPSNVFETLGKFGAAVGAITGVAGGVIAWVYRTASVRLGVVDLFACEITTLCRVGTIVDWIAQRIAAFEREYGVPAAELSDSGLGNPATAPPEPPTQLSYRFTSSEEYFPVFAGNSRDLQVLEADVVTNVTAFYTYMKVSRDYLRRLGELPAGPDTREEMHQLWCNIIYMQFLAYEAARQAVDELIEYEPTHTQNAITILLTEVVAYGFLRRRYPEDDIRFKRLDLRQKGYESLAETLHRRIAADHSAASEPEKAEWKKAEALWPELAKRYREYLGMTIEGIDEGDAGRARIIPAAA